MKESNLNTQPLPKCLAMISSRAIVGIDAMPVVVEVHLANGLPSFSTVGMPETAVKESKDRVRGAIINSGFEFPAKRITVNLAPADLPKSGGNFDLPIAIGILIASGQVPGQRVDNTELVGELALDGGLREARGVLPTALACKRAERRLIVPKSNAREAGLVSGIDALAAEHLLSVCSFLAGQSSLSLCSRSNGFDEGEIREQSKNTIPELDLSDVRGQPLAKRALEVSAAGGHSLIMVGPPGAGKSMLAARLPTILPRLDDRKALETAAIHSIAFGRFEVSEWRKLPFRNPHHSCSPAALVGGGTIPMPGEISKSHNGVLFLDELTEFSRSSIEQLREPLETGEINIARASAAVSFPANFHFISACNPCRCGYWGDGTDRCKCSAASLESYRAKLSGPLIDRIDLHVVLPKVDLKELSGLAVQSERCESSAVVRRRVEACRQFQIDRSGKLNSELSVPELENETKLSSSLNEFLCNACDRLNLSARAYHRILKLSRTLADMDKSAKVARRHLAEAIGFRGLDRLN